MRVGRVSSLCLQMKVAFCCPEYLTQRGGAQLYCRRVAEELCALGHEVTILTEEPNRGNPPISVVGPVCILSLRKSGLYTLLFRTVGAIRKLRGGRYWVGWFVGSTFFKTKSKGPHCLQLRHKSLYAPYDAVVLAMSGACSWGEMIGRALEHSSVVTVALPFYHVSMGMYDWPVQKRIHQRFSCTVTLTAFEKAFLCGQGWKHDRIVVGGVGSDEQPGAKKNAFRRRYCIDEHVPVVLFLGRKNYHKGVTHLIDGMEDVWEKHPDTRLVLIGFTQNSRDWIDGYLMSSTHGAVEKTIDLYDVSEQEREEALADASMMVLPSVNDSFGISYLDAWRHRIPVVGCRDTCCEDVIDDGRDGLLVSFGVPQEIGVAVNRLLEDDTLRREMGERGYEKWKAKYTWKRMAEQMSNLLEYLMLQKEQMDVGHE